MLGVSPKVTRRLEKVEGVTAKRAYGNKVYLNLILTEAAKSAVKAAFNADPEEIAV